MRKLVFAALAVLGCAALSGAAQAQGVTRLCTPLYNAASGALSCPEVGQTGPGNGTNPLPVAPYAYPVGATAITGNAAGTTGAVVGTLAGVAGKTIYICGFNVSAIGGTAAVGPITIAGLITASMVYQLASSATGVTSGQTFTPCIPASALNTAITITTTADGSASAVDVNSWGYQLSP